MHSDRFHAELGPPEDQPTEGMAYTFTQKAVRIAADAGFRDLGLAQLDGMLLALDWVANDTHHVWGTAVMVGPGVAVGGGGPGVGDGPAVGEGVGVAAHCAW